MKTSKKLALPNRIVDITDRDLTRLTDLAIVNLEAANDPPKLFRQATTVVRIGIDSLSGDRAIIYPVGKDSMRKMMATSAKYVAKRIVRNRIARVNVAPPLELVENVLAHPDALPFPVLRGLKFAPYFHLSKNGDVRLVRKHGFDPTSQLYLSLDPSIEIPAVASNPNAAELAAAVAVYDDLFAEFPFAEPADRANAFALAISPFARNLTGDYEPSPLMLIEAPHVGTGKTLLAMVALMAGCGSVPVQAFGRDEAEQTKRITAILMRGTAGVLLDNLTGKINSAPLARLLSSDGWGDRALGSHTQLALTNQAVWCATLNNADLSDEIQRRCCPIKIDAQMERPNERRIKRQEPLLPFAKANRGRLIGAALTIISAWVASGRPESTKLLGGFESWSRVIGGCLENAGVAGFLENYSRFLETANDDNDTLQTFFGAWAELYGEDSVATATLMTLADGVGIDLGNGGNHSQRIRLGRLLSATKGRFFGRGLRLEKRPPSRGVPQWGLKATETRGYW